ncbi:hypothetical protein [Actinomyces haliotis]|uniref:hypothetical protein n=1 Tax=Actinomyces haliotis TaxID=1280843 RepID=UPI0018905F62|nr:hypothetical protein [Actinomyces haliotis]
MNPPQIGSAIRHHLVGFLLITVVLALAGVGMALRIQPSATVEEQLVMQPGLPGSTSEETSAAASSSGDKTQSQQGAALAAATKSSAATNNSYQLATYAMTAMPTLVELTTSPAIMDAAAKTTGDDSDALAKAVTASNPTSTLLLSVKATAATKKEAVARVDATVEALQTQLASGELLGVGGTVLNPAVTTPATTESATMARTGAKGDVIVATAVGLMLAILYAMWAEGRDRKRADHGRRAAGRDGDGSTVAEPGADASTAPEAEIVSEES